MAGLMHDQTIEAIAEAEYARANGAVEKTVEAMMGVISADTAPYRKLVDPLAQQAYYKRIRKICRRERKPVWIQPHGPAGCS